eukprot:PhM_4_TR505/c1_g1_i1/m.78366/K10397/KIF6_9; kinesin family member 6/9
MVRSAIKVVLRTRPTDSFAADAIRLQDDQKTLAIHIPKKADKSGATINHTQENYTFKLDQILHNATQEQMFDGCGAEIVGAALEGYNGTILAYGQTGGGKTYTMMGGGDYKTRGMVPRIIKHLFDEATTRAEKLFEISVSFMEIYNEHIRDLLDVNNAEELQIQEDSKGAIGVKGLTKRVCSREAEALQYLFEGAANRVTGEHVLNPASSRSHCVYTIHVSSRTRIESGAAALTSKIHCIDLAGSERLSKSGSEGQLMKEAQYINKSLSFLEHVVLSLGGSNRSHVPFRQSKLTNLLKDSLGGNCQTTMIANVWPEARHMEESLSTLKFASRMMKVQNDASVNVVLDDSTQIKQLQKLVGELKAELQMQNQLHGKSHVAYEGDLGEDERFEMEKVVRTFFQDPQAQIPINSLREVKEYFRIIRAYVQNLEAEIVARGGAAGGQPPSAGGVSATGLSGTKGRGSMVGLGGTNASRDGAHAGGHSGMGEVDGSGGHGIGVAAAARNIREIVASTHNPSGLSASPQGAGHKSPVPPSSSRLHGAMTHEGDDVHDTSGVSPMPGSSAAAQSAPRVAVPDRNRAYEDFKLADGLELHRLMRDTQDQLMEKRQLIQDVCREVNTAKAKIDTLKEQLEAAQMQRLSSVGGKDLVDEGEQALMVELRQCKGEYRTLHERFTGLRTEKEYLTKMVEQSRGKLLQEFEAWYARLSEGGGNPNGGGDAVSNMLHRGATVGDQLDEGERFELMEVAKIMDEDPDSLAFYSARKAVPAGTKPRKPGQKISVSTSRVKR